MTLSASSALLCSVRRCVSCRHRAQQPSSTLDTCVKAALTSDWSTTGCSFSRTYCESLLCTPQKNLLIDLLSDLFFARFEEPSPPSCGFCHIPYDELNMPFPTQLTYCYHCRRQKVANAKMTPRSSRLSFNLVFISLKIYTCKHPFTIVEGA